ncbi:MAG: hypothetical protein M3619_24985 [Myxococcota bacterium]|nr:hypothetical protein [Myxococcota bacterium]
MSTWIERWRDWVSATAEMPGVYRRRDGGFHVRGRATDPRTGKLREVNLVLPECKRARDAALELAAGLAKIREGAIAAPGRMPRFADWAVTVLERKIAGGDISSASGRKTWDWALRVHLIPAFGELFVDKLTREDVERWKERELLAARTKAKDEKRNRTLDGGRYRPQTANTVLAILRQITGAASDTFTIADPCRSIANVSKRGHRTYTYEAPNALKPEDVPRFLDAMRVSFPEHYAFVFLGFTTGLRPSSMRPLRWRGASADVKWDECKLLVRRSHTHKSEVMDATKTDRDQVLALDERQLEVLRWHVDRLEHENQRRSKRAPELGAAMAASELLFPASPTKWSNGGGCRAQSCLDKPFAAIVEALKLPYKVTPRAMRRTYQDLARTAKVPDIVTRAISGHATPEMQRHYSTVSGDEMRAGMAKVIDIATGRERAA